jgi:hypothetical protein
MPAGGSLSSTFVTDSGQTLGVDTSLPAVLGRGARSRQPLEVSEAVELVETSLTERRRTRLAELDRATGRVDLEVPEPPAAKMPRKGTPMLPPAPGATGGTIRLARRAWIAKYDPTRAEREKQLDPMDRTIEHSDVFADPSWSDPAKALGEPWLHSWLMRGAAKLLPDVAFGDLVFVIRTDHLLGDPVLLKRRTIVGVWWFEARIDEWYYDDAGRIRWVSMGATFPLRRFNFPVPILATGDEDAAFHNVAAFRDLSRASFLDLTPDEAVAVTRACGLPAAVLTEPDPDRLAGIVSGLDLGPPTLVRRRILEGARGSAHRISVEKAAIDVALDELRRARFSVVSTEKQRGIGSDLWAQSVDASGNIISARVEVKGLSGASWKSARLTRSERDAAVADAGRSGWWLLIVTRALSTANEQRWLSSAEAAKVFSIPTDGGAVYVADPSVVL